MILHEFRTEDRPFSVEMTGVNDSRCSDTAPGESVPLWYCSLPDGHDGLHVAIAGHGRDGDVTSTVQAFWGEIQHVKETPEGGMSHDLALALIQQWLRDAPVRRQPQVRIGDRARVLRRRAVEHMVEGGLVGDWHEVAARHSWAVGAEFTVERLTDGDGDLRVNLRGVFYASSWEKIETEPSEESYVPRDALAEAEHRAEKAEQDLATLWAALADEAKRRDWCRDYDAFAEKHGGPRRPVTRLVEVDVTSRNAVEVTVPYGAPREQVEAEAVRVARETFPAAFVSASLHSDPDGPMYPWA